MSKKAIKNSRKEVVEIREHSVKVFENPDDKNGLGTINLGIKQYKREHPNAKSTATFKAAIWPKAVERKMLVRPHRPNIVGLNR